MARINDNLPSNSPPATCSPKSARRVDAFPAGDRTSTPRSFRLGIGDVTVPCRCPRPWSRSYARRSRRVGRSSHSVKGYGPEQGYPFLREAIAKQDYQSRGCNVEADEIFISDGSKCDTGNVLDILGDGNVIAVQDPVYPVYVDTNVMAGNTGVADDKGRYGNLVYLPCTAENDFTPVIPKQKVDVIYLCYPNNPTGAVATKETLKSWVDYAKSNGALILFDAAYEAFITDPTLPHSIYEIEGARDCAMEFRSFSKNAGFTGVRCGLTVVPKSLQGVAATGDKVALHGLWNRRQSTKFNGASYVVQRGAAAAYTPEGQAQIRSLIDFYMGNAEVVRESLGALGIECFGGVNAPYVWIKTPAGLGSWAFFDKLLNEAHVVGTPGAGFGAAGEGYFRISAFNSRTNVEQAMERIKQRISL